MATACPLTFELPARGQIDPGTYQYKFVIDGSTWVPNPGNPDGAPVGFGGRIR